MILRSVFWLTLLTALANGRPQGLETGMWGWVAVLAVLDYTVHRK